MRFKKILQYFFLAVYFALLAAAVYGNFLYTQSRSSGDSSHPLKAKLDRVLPEYENEPWKDVFSVGRREIFPGYAEGKRGIGQRLSGFAYRIPDDSGEGPVQLLLGIDAAGKITGVTPLSVSAPFGFAEEFVQQAAFFESFLGKNSGEIRSKEEGGQIPTVIGAALLSRQVIEIVRQGLEFYEQHQDFFLRVLPEEPGSPEVVLEPEDIEEIGIERGPEPEFREVNDAAA